MNKVCILVRRSFDFYYNLEHKFHANAAVNNDHIEGMARATEYWETLFGCSWAMTRRKIANIVTQHNLQCMPDSMIMHCDNLQLPNNGWVIPVDDDDLLDIRIITKIRNYNNNKETLHWPVNVLNGHKLIENVSDSSFFAANSYAISSTLANKDIGYAILQRHCYAGKHTDYKVISDKPLGLKITHPASIGMLKLYRDEQDCRSAVDKFINTSYVGIYAETVDMIKRCFVIC